MEMCRSGRFSAADLSACVSAGPTSEPTLRRVASAVDVGTRVRKVKREQHHTHTARNSTRLLTKQCNGPPTYVASIPLWSEVEIRQTSSDVSFLLLHEMLQHAVLEDTEHDWVAADVSQVGFANRLHEWSAHLGVDTTQGHWACMSVLERQRAIVCEGFSFRFPSHVAALDWLSSESLLDLCSEQAPFVRVWVLRKTHHGRRFPGFGVVFQGALFGALATARPQGRAFRATFVARQCEGTKLAHLRGVPRQDRRLGLAEASRRPYGVE